MLSATAVGPMLTFFVPRMSSVAVGKEMTGPALQMTLPTFAGDKKKEACTSPSPLVPFTLRERSGTWITGMIVRVIRFQSFDNLKRKSLKNQIPLR